MTTIKHALQQATARLKTTSSTPRIDAETLLLHTLKNTRAFLYAHDTDVLNPGVLATFEALIANRSLGVPIAYLTQSKEFWSLPLRVTPATLIPRPETELLVECTLALLAEQQQATILELGTGSGAIAIALAASRPDWHITACDISNDALNIATHNASQCKLNNITWIHSNWFQSIPPQTFDAIISNPPYLADNDPHLSQEDLRFEPRLALTSGADGLTALSHIIQTAPRYLKSQGCILLEHGYQQTEQVFHLLKTAHFEKLQNWLDLQHHPRVSGGFLQ